MKANPFLRGVLSFSGWLLVASAALAVTVKKSDWKKIIHQGDLPKIEQATDFVSAAHDGLEDRAKKTDAKSIKEVEALLKLPSLPFKDAELVGKWKCRSIQGGGLGVYVYPYFSCNILKKGSDLYLEKKSGSQFRKGHIYPDGEDRRVFLGVQYVSGDDPGEYSGTYPQEEVDGESMQYDSAGVLLKKGDKHFIFILDAAPDDYEIYELKK